MQVHVFSTISSYSVLQTLFHVQFLYPVKYRAEVKLHQDKIHSDVTRNLALVFNICILAVDTVIYAFLF